MWSLLRYKGGAQRSQVLKGYSAWKILLRQFSFGFGAVPLPGMVFLPTMMDIMIPLTTLQIHPVMPVGLGKKKTGWGWNGPLGSSAWCSAGSDRLSACLDEP